MSEIIHVTLIIENGNEKSSNEENKNEGNKNAQKQGGSRQEIKITHDINTTLMSTLLKENLISGAFCGGRGSCGRCRIQFLGEAPIPTASDRSVFTPDELREGYRLACMSRPKKDCVIRRDCVAQQPIEILTTAQNAVKLGKREDTTYLIAVDLGTTTIAMQLMEINSGNVIDTYCAMNPQRSYGADVLSRIQAANTGHGKSLRDSVWSVLQAGVDRFRRFGEPCCMCIAGNTTMEHLLMGLSTEKLGRSPFTPVEIGLQKCTFPDSGSIIAKSSTRSNTKTDTNAGTQVYITPGISAFVGGDIVAGLYHCGLLDGLQSGREQDEGGLSLFIDLGTNGEMAITDGSHMLVTAVSAGPAFEGGANATVPGSDMLAIIASLRKQGVIDETGLLQEEYFEHGIDVPIQNIKGSGETVIHLTQKNIRDIQMAKAAVRAGIEILIEILMKILMEMLNPNLTGALSEKTEKPKLTQVYLAGGFGYYLDVDTAIAVGLLPEYMRHLVTAAGNTSLAGAYDMGRDLWTGRLKEETLEKKLKQVESINLAEQENFEALYLRFLNFPTAEV